MEKLSEIIRGSRKDTLKEQVAHIVKVRKQKAMINELLEMYFGQVHPKQVHQSPMKNRSQKSECGLLAVFHLLTVPGNVMDCLAVQIFLDEMRYGETNVLYVCPFQTY